MSVQLDPAQLATVSELGVQRRLRHGQVLFREGEPARFVYVLLAGRVRVVVGVDHGEERTLAEIGAGQLVGEMGVLDGAVRSATALVDEPGRAVVLGADDFEATMLAHPALAVRMVRAMGNHLRETSAQLAAQQSGTVLQRVVRRLIAMLDEADVTGPVTLQVTRAELGSWVGASRESVSRALAELRDQGLVELHRGAVHVPTPHVLRAARLG